MLTSRQIISVVIIAFLVGSVGSIFFDRVVIPYLATLPGLSALQSLQTDSPIIINRREQIQIEDGVNLVELTKQAQSFTASIYTGPGQDLRLLGTGIILTADGLIFTSRNVVGDNTQVTVVLNDGKSFLGQVRALDRKTEVVVLTIEANNLGVAQFDDASELEIGQRVIALGKTVNPYTRLFASGSTTRTVTNSTSFDQAYSSENITESFGHSAVLNADFVGGPVINNEGRVVGLVTNAAGTVLTSEALSQTLSTYLQNGRVTRPYIGIEYQNFSKTVAELKGLSEAGSLITKIAADSPARAGLRVGDLVTAVNGTNVESMSFERLINRLNPGETRFTVLREGVRVDVVFNVEVR
jgi:S1-C subfamily serine protease